MPANGTAALGVGFAQNLEAVTHRRRNTQNRMPRRSGNVHLHALRFGGLLPTTVGTTKGGLVVRRTLLLPLISMMLAFCPRSQAQQASPTLKKVAEFDLPGPPGKRFDYLTIDPDDHYLISAHLAAGQTYVIDLRTNKSSCNSRGYSRRRRCRVRI